MKIFILSCLLLAVACSNSFGQSKETLKLLFKEAPFVAGKSKIPEVTTSEAGGLTIEIDSIDATKISKSDGWKFIKEDDTELGPATTEITDQKRVYKFLNLNSSLENDTLALRVRGKLAGDDNALLWSFKVSKLTNDSSKNKRDDKTPPKENISPEAYLSKIRELHPLFEQDKVYREENTVYLFMDENLERIPGTEFPDCIEKNTAYLIQYFSRKDSLQIVFRGVVRKGSDIITIRGVSAQATPAITPLFAYTSQSLGPFDGGADFFVQIATNPAKNFSFNSCSESYHVSISAGFFGSSLNNPLNITQAAPGGTLYADNQTTQKALTIMALFYPIPRDPYYKYKELDFWQKWSFSFGTKLSENIFDDLLLGLNFEFSKGGNFTGGIHYGQHRVIRGDKKFQFGKDTFAGTFDNSHTNLRWDVGFFFGVTLDLRIVNALRSNGRDQNKRNDEGANKTKQPTP